MVKLYNIIKNIICIFLLCMYFSIHASYAHKSNKNYSINFPEKNKALQDYVLSSEKLCQRLEKDFALKGFMLRNESCHTFELKNFNRILANKKILTEAIYESDAIIVLSIWTHGGRTKNGNSELLDLLLQRISRDVRVTDLSLSGEEFTRKKKDILIIKLMIYKLIDIYKNNIIKNLSKINLLKHSLINNFCSEDTQHIFNGEDFLKAFKEKLGEKISLPSNGRGHRKKYDLLINAGILNEECVISARKLFSE